MPSGPPACSPATGAATGTARCCRCTCCRRPVPEAVERLRTEAAVPFWAPSPLLPGWTVTGIGWAGDDRSGTRGTVLACTGPAPLGGVADLLLVAEEPGVGLGPGMRGCRRGGDRPIWPARPRRRCTRPATRPRCGRCSGRQPIGRCWPARRSGSGCGRCSGRPRPATCCWSTSCCRPAGTGAGRLRPRRALALPGAEPGRVVSRPAAGGGYRDHRRRRRWSGLVHLT